MKRFTRGEVVAILVAALLLTGITYLISTFRTPDPPTSTRSSNYLAFASKATTGQQQLTALVGGISLIGGISSGKLQLANHTSYPTHAQDGGTSIDITLPQGALLHAMRNSIRQELSLGDFTVVQNDQQIATGTWSAIQVQTPQNVISYEFLDDPATGRDYSGAMVMGTSSGTLYTPEGTVIDVTSKRTGTVNSTSPAAVTFLLQLPQAKTLTCIGKPLAQSAMQGMSGVFEDPDTHQLRVCNALVFS